jgi:FixJ family two-component response regulator
MTAYALTDLIEEAQKEAFLFIDKPFDIPAILEIFKKIASREESGKRKVAILSRNLDSVAILKDKGYDVSSFDNIDTFLRSEPESFRSVLIEPVSEDTVNDFHRKLKEQKLNLRLIQ